MMGKTEFSPSRSHVECYCYFLVLVIIIGTYKNIVSTTRLCEFSQIRYRPTMLIQPNLCRLMPLQQRFAAGEHMEKVCFNEWPIKECLEIEGESFFPIQVHSRESYFYYSSMLFLFLLLPSKMQSLCQLSIFIEKTTGYKISPSKGRSMTPPCVTYLLHYLVWFNFR